MILQLHRSSLQIDWEQLLVPSDFESAKELQDEISTLILVPLVAILFNVLWQSHIFWSESPSFWLQTVMAFLLRVETLAS